MKQVLTENTVLVFSASFSELENQADSFHLLLSLEEQVRAQKYKVPKARREFVVSRGFLREKLSFFLNKAPKDIVIDVDFYGKPFIKSADCTLSFNMSHSEDRLVLAVTQGKALGIDIEKINFQQDLEIVHQVFSQSEITELSAYQSTRKVKAFFKGWTQKEAFIKALGMGMSYPLKAFSVLLNPDEQGRLIHAEQESVAFHHEWNMQCLEIDPDYHCSLFVQGNDFKVVLCA